MVDYNIIIKNSETVNFAALNNALDARDCKPTDSKPYKKHKHQQTNEWQI